MRSHKKCKIACTVSLTPLYSDREKARRCQLIVHMDGALTTITNPQDPNDRKNYTFDHSYWSFDGFEVDSQGLLVPDPQHPNGHRYCDQV